MSSTLTGQLQTSFNLSEFLSPGTYTVGFTLTDGRRSEYFLRHTGWPANAGRPIAIHRHTIGTASAPTENS